MGRLLTTTKAAELLGIKPKSLSVYACQGRITPTRKTIGGHNLYDEDDLITQLGNKLPHPEKEDNRARVFYTRASNGDPTLLKTQKAQLTTHYGTPDKTYTDKASGLNENRKGLNKLLEDAHNRKIKEVCITNRDRLTRFGYRYLERILSYDDVKILILDDELKQHELDETDPASELMRDFMSLIASFSGRFYRLRGWKQQKELLKEAEKNIQEKEVKNNDKKEETQK